MPSTSKKTIAAALAAFLATAGITGIAVTADQPVPGPPAASSRPSGPAPSPSPSGDAKGPYEVLRVVDGDTVHVLIDGVDETLRLIGMDTPETVHPSRPVECYGPEASNEAKELLTGEDVYVTTDPTQDHRDHYGRLLAYVELEDGTDFAEHMILGGFAEEYLFDEPYARHGDYVAAEELAQEAGNGLWTVCS